MKEIAYDSLQVREIFHLEFLRWLSRKIKVKYYALKGGVNLRFFFGSLRYSEDMDLDVQGIAVYALKEAVLGILESSSFHNVFKPFGLERIVPPDISRAKQTATTQRFKIHLITFAGQDLFTKIEFSRRGFKEGVSVEPVANTILRAYKLPPLIVPHYDIQAALTQKLGALAGRVAIQARDVFDLYLLNSQYEPSAQKTIKISDSKLTQAHENIFDISFEQFRDSVVSYLSGEEQALYSSPALWDEIKLKVANFIEELRA